MVGTEDWVPAPVEPDAGKLRDLGVAAISRAVFGLIAARGLELRLGPLTVFRFGEPRRVGDCWAWPIEGGLAVGRPGGRLLLAWRRGHLVSVVAGYTPRVPEWLYRLAQLPVHHWVTRRALRWLATAARG